MPTDLHETLDKYQKNKISIDKKRDEYEKNRLILQIVEENIDYNYEDQSIGIDFIPQNLHIEEQDQCDGQSIAERYGCFNPGKQMTYDVGVDIGITRKQIEEDDCILHKMPESQYRELVRSLNTEQKAFFYHILHWFKSKDEPLYNFLSFY